MKTQKPQLNTVSGLDVGKWTGRRPWHLTVCNTSSTTMVSPFLCLLFTYFAKVCLKRMESQYLLRWRRELTSTDLSQTDAIEITSHKDSGPRRKSRSSSLKATSRPVDSCRQGVETPTQRVGASLHVPRIPQNMETDGTAVANTIISRKSAILKTKEDGTISLVVVARVG